MAVGMLAHQELGKGALTGLSMNTGGEIAEECREIDVSGSKHDISRHGSKVKRKDKKRMEFLDLPYVQFSLIVQREGKRAG